MPTVLVLRVAPEAQSVCKPAEMFRSDDAGGLRVELVVQLVEFDLDKIPEPFFESAESLHSMHAWHEGEAEVGVK